MSKYQSEMGTAILETIIIVPVFFIVMISVIDTVHLVDLNLQSARFAHEGVRYLATLPDIKIHRSDTSVDVTSYTDERINRLIEVFCGDSPKLSGFCKKARDQRVTFDTSFSNDEVRVNISLEYIPYRVLPMRHTVRTSVTAPYLFPK